ncbi:c-type cytochrome biogenesis protein CcsB [Arthrobacter sedimenti]|uniref:c-type cytochrome biogenesis protein CcsB n=1 Tax=Arthrobacter sedimenti TaxID=2694931 RepID=UPI000B357AD0|nr:c-type cytochrome biogenesis protein CcsB [Arthrobacter sedimenti]OUM42036.1 c-type cytochrome biogenesis protein CcsB [Arthrobacter agilis]
MTAPVNAELGQVSELFMLLASIAYVVALVFFVLDLVKSSPTIGSLEARLAGEQAASARALAGVGSRGAGSTPVAARTSSVADSMDYGSGPRRRTARIAVSLTVLAAVIHGAAVITRGVAAHRVPWGNMYEFCTTGAFLVAAIFLITLTRKDLRFVGSFVVGLVVIMLCAATVGFPTPVARLIPALQSYWLIVHVSIAVASSALFTITFSMSVLQLLQTSREAKLSAGKADPARFLRLVPSALSLENLSYRLNAIAFVGWTFTLMAGAIWAEQAWGRYWGWDTKEVWTFVIWTVYAGYLHARATRGWTGTRAAWLSIVGYLCIVFNFTIVNIYFSGLHSYSGV